MPGKDLPEVHIVNFDKFAHVFVFFVLNSLYLIWNNRSTSAKKFNPYLITFSCIAYGGLIEILQGLFYTDRYSDFFDFAANSVGCVVGLVLVKQKCYEL